MHVLYIDLCTHKHIYMSMHGCLHTCIHICIYIPAIHIILLYHLSSKKAEGLMAQLTENQLN